MVEQGHNVALATLSAQHLVESTGQDLLTKAAKVEAQPVVDGGVAHDGSTAVSAALDHQFVIMLKGKVAAFNLHR